MSRSSVLQLMKGASSLGVRYNHLTTQSILEKCMAGEGRGGEECQGQGALAGDMPSPTTERKFSVHAAPSNTQPAFQHLPQQQPYREVYRKLPQPPSDPPRQRY